MFLFEQKQSLASQATELGLRERSLHFWQYSSEGMHVHSLKKKNTEKWVSARDSWLLGSAWYSAKNILRNTRARNKSQEACKYLHNPWSRPWERGEAAYFAVNMIW